MDISSSAIENRLAVFRRLCREHRLTLTPQRLAIFQALAGDASHPSADEVFRSVKPSLLSLSLGTVYRTLELFETHGLIARVQVPGAQARFDANQEQHAHLVCIRCRQVRDIPAPPSLPSLPKAGRLGGFRVLAQRLHYLGICPACQPAT